MLEEGSVFSKFGAESYDCFLSTPQHNGQTKIKLALALEMETRCAASVPVGTCGNSPAIHRWETDRPRLSSKSRRDGRASHRRRGEKGFRPSLQDLKREGNVTFPAMNRWAIADRPYGTLIADRPYGTLIADRPRGTPIADRPYGTPRSGQLSTSGDTLPILGLYLCWAVLNDWVQENFRTFIERRQRLFKSVPPVVTDVAADSQKKRHRGKKTA